MSLNKNKLSIGGYFGLEYGEGKEYHPNALALNTGRNCLEYILRAKKFTKIWIPYYTCEAVMEPVKRTGIKFGFYQIDDNLEPEGINPLNSEAVLYTNYFGIKGAAARKTAAKYRNVIIDNSQAFFEKPVNGIDTFYSPRKFFGVPDGGYLYTDKKLRKAPDEDVSFMRFAHLLKRTDVSPEEGYEDFKKAEESLSGLPVMSMSRLTKRLLSGVNYGQVMKTRKANFSYLHKAFKGINELNISISDFVPMAYPLLISKRIRTKLIEERIYIPVYWNSVLKLSGVNSFEYKLADKLLALPIDQRYGKPEMDKIINTVRKYA